MAFLAIGHAAVLVGASHFITKGWSLATRWVATGRKMSAAVLLILAAYFFYLAWAQGIAHI